jgi:hypothetical protein
MPERSHRAHARRARAVGVDIERLRRPHDGAARLSTHEAKDADYPTCGTPPKAEHKTVIVVSTKTQ